MKRKITVNPVEKKFVFDAPFRNNNFLFKIINLFLHGFISQSPKLVFANKLPSCNESITKNDENSPEDHNSFTKQKKQIIIRW